VTTKAAQLYGVISPTGQSDGFCVPVFIDPEQSNHLLVQIVDEQNYIESFEPFFSSVEIKAIDINVDKKVGDSAFWYFGLKNGPLSGSIEDIRSQFHERKIEIENSPYILLQVVAACQIDGQEAAVQTVHDLLAENVGRAGANAWLDTNVLSPKIRDWLHKSRKTRRKFDFGKLASKVLAITDGNSTSVLVPEELKSQIRDEDWRSMTEQLASLLKFFDLRFAGLIFQKHSALRNISNSNVPLLKREAVSAFAKGKGTTLQQITKSYFEDSSGALRVVCTFSSRYEGKGKRKYWFGYHEIWNRWLEGSRDGFLLLGCADTRTCFALPLRFVRAQLPNLRSTGIGKDQYWHLDLVDVATKTNLLDIPRIKQAATLSEFAFKF
jgi:hypothetical protein